MLKQEPLESLAEGTTLARLLKLNASDANECLKKLEATKFAIRIFLLVLELNVSSDKDTINCSQRNVLFDKAALHAKVREVDPADVWKVRDCS